MLGYVAIVQIYFFKFYIRNQGKERPAKTKLLLAKLCVVWYTFGSVVNFICRLCAVLVIFDFWNIFEIVDPKSPGNWSFQKSYQIVWLSAVSYCTESDSAQYHTAWSLTPRSIILHWVWLRAVLDNFGFSDISISGLCTVSHCTKSHFSGIGARKQIFLQNHFRQFIRDPDGLDSWKKMKKILWHCLFKQHLMWHCPLKLTVRLFVILIHSLTNFSNTSTTWWQ